MMNQDSVNASIVGRTMGSQAYKTVTLLVIVCIGLCLVSHCSYLLFHGVVEIFSIVVAGGIFFLAWNARAFLKNNYFLVLGVGFLFMAGFDFLHTLAYKGMAVFPDQGANLATQLWIAARYIESISLLAAALLLNRKARPAATFTVYSLISILILGTIFYWKVFPVCYVDGVGLTAFKKTSEYIICIIFAASLGMLFKLRDRFNEGVMRLVALSILFTICSELAFTFYVDVYELSNLIGHLFKLVSFVLIYKAIIETGFRRPYEILLRELQREQLALRGSNLRLEQCVADRTRELRESEQRFRGLLASLTDDIVVIDEHGNIVWANDVAMGLFGSAMVGKKCYSVYRSSDRICDSCPAMKTLATGRIHNVEVRRTTADGETHFYWSTTSVAATYDDGRPKQVLAISRDITDRKKAEDELRASEERYRRLFEDAPLMYVITRNEPSEPFVSDCNEMFLSTLGYSRDEVLGRPLTDFYSPEARAKMLEHGGYARALRGEFLIGERDLVTRDGRLVPTLLYTAVETVFSGRIIFSRCIYVDITDRKKAEDALMASEERYRQLVDLLPVGIVIHCEGKYCFLNPAALRFFGATHPDRLIGTSILERTHPDHRERVANRIQTVVTEWKPAPVVDTPCLKLDGTVMQAEIRTAPIMYDDKPSVLSALLDITDRKQLENEVRESEARFRELAELLPGFVYELDSKGNILFMNRAGRESHGYTEEAIANGVNLIETLVGKDRKRAERHLGKILEGAPTKGAEYLAQRKDGTTFPIVAYGSRITRDGNAVGIRGISFDITERKQAEEAILEERRKFKVLTDNIPCGLVLIGDDGVFRYINPTFEQMFGYGLNEIPTGRAWLRKAFPDPEARRKAVAVWIEDVKAGPQGAGRSKIFVVRCRDETYKIVYFMRTQLTSGEHLMTCLDVTERARAETLLAESEEKYRTLVETSPDAIMVQVGEVLEFANLSAVKMMGMNNADELIGRRVLDCIHPEFRELVAERMRVTLEEGRPVVPAEVKVCRRDGAVLDVESAAYPIMYQGRPARQIVARDITERKKTEKALEDSERKFRELAELLPQVVYEIDMTGKFTFINLKGLAISGYTMEDYERGINAFEAVAPEDHSRLAENMGKVLRGEDLGGNEYLGRRKDGSTFPIMITSARILQDGKVAGIRGVGMDISRIKEAEEQILASLEEKKLLLREVHHRVKNNLQVISSMIRLQIRSMTDEQAKDSLTVLDGRVSTIALVHEYLHRSPNLASIAVKDHLRSVVVPILSYQAPPGMNLNLNMDVGDISWGIDTAIPVGLIVNELVTNSAKHAFPDVRDGVIGVSLRSIDDGMFELTVSDNGIGLPEDVNLPTSKTLGLNLVSMFAEQIGAEIEVKREAGTEFKFRFRERVKRRRKGEG